MSIDRRRKIVNGSSVDAKYKKLASAEVTVKTSVSIIEGKIYFKNLCFFYFESSTFLSSWMETYDKTEQMDAQASHALN